MMAAEEDRYTVCSSLNEYPKRIHRARPQGALADFVTLAAEGNQRMPVAPTDLEITNLQSCCLRTVAVHEVVVCILQAKTIA